MIGQQSKAREQLARSTLASLSVVMIPITAGAICHALRMATSFDCEKGPRELREDKIPNPDSIVESGQGLVAIDPVTSVVTIPCYDIEEYLRDHWDNVFAPSVKVQLTKALLAYLSLDAFVSGPCYDKKDFNRRLGDYPLMNYASQYWAHHIHGVLSLGTPGQCIFEWVNRFTAKRSNLESSLQVSSMTPKPQKVPQVLSRSTREGLLHTQRVSRVNQRYK